VAEYVKGALKEQGGGQCYSRLLQLAPRKKLRDTVDQATALPPQGDNPKLDAVKLRMAVLDAQSRPKDVEGLLAEITKRTNSLELLDWLEQTAREKSLSNVQEAVLERQAAVTTDPVRRMEICYSLVSFYESQKKLDAAQRNLEELYREHPKIMGVVRATVDFYWRHKEQQRAINVLSQAAKDSYPDLRKQFLYEAARKETDAGQYVNARNILGGLLTDAPYDDEYLAATADTFARAGDDQGLKAFYLEKIDLFRQANLPQDRKTREIAGLRRGLIPALTRLKDHAGAVDQYIEIANKFPEDDSLVSEAALYAEKYSREKQLTDYYANTIRQSPKDYRWPMALARTQTQLEHYPAAIDAYTVAIQVRPDRADLRTARAELLERTMRFDEAAADYQRLYELNYHDAQWMEKLATVRARQGKIAETVAALQSALIDGRPEKPSNYFEVARRLEQWGMLQQAREFAQKGVDSAGRDLLAAPDNRSGAHIYARIMTRLRQQDAACQRLWQGVADGNSLGAQIAVAVQQVEKNGILSITDQRWREREIRLRQNSAQAGMIAAMTEMGLVVSKYFTPEEKVAFSSWLERTATNASTDDLINYYLSAASSANLGDLEARWNDRLMMMHARVDGGQFKSRLVTLQTRRLRFEELGGQLERYAATLSPDHGKYGVLLEAADAYREGADYDREMAVLGAVDYRLSGDHEKRYFALLLQKEPTRLVEIAGREQEAWAFPALQYAVRNGDFQLAQKAIAARGLRQEPVWTPAYTALAGLYDSERTAGPAFVSALGDATIGERISKPADRSRQLAGNTWFYYGSRYGEWLGVTGTGDPEDFLPAILEQSPGTSSSYVTVAQYYADSGKLDRALADYAHTLELTPGRADIHDKMALLLWRQKKRDEAVAEWKQALEMFDAQVNQRSVPADFRENFRYTLNHIGNRRLMPELRPSVDTVLRDYVRHNGSYEAGGILREAFVAAGDAQAAAAWMLELAAVAPERASFLQMLVTAKWIPANAKEPVYQQYISQLQAQVQKSDALAREYAQQDLRQWQVNYAQFLLDQGQVDRAAFVLDSLPKFETPGQDEPAEGASDPIASNRDELAARLRIAIARNRLDEVFGGYRDHPETAPANELLRGVATTLQKAGQKPAARKILEYVFTAEIGAHQLNAANMLGLAEIRIEDGDLPGAMEVLQRLTLVVGQPFENMDAAASLLARTGHHAEAAGFLAELLKAAPWDEGVRLRLAQEQLAAGIGLSHAQAEAARVASDSQASYADREDAASILKGRGAASLGSVELDALASGTLAADFADRPYFYAARLRAANKRDAPEAKERFLQNALSDTPARDAGRVPLFRTLAGEGKDRLAISVMEPLLQKDYANVIPYWQPNQGADGEAEGSPEPESSPDEPAPTESAQERVTAAQKAVISSEVASSYRKLEEYENALRYLQIAKKLEPDKTRQAEIDKSIAGVRATMRRIANNDERAPMMHKELEQIRTVRPKLAAMKSPPSVPAKAKGGAQ
jgi:predicted Zn-dependent protease